MANSQGFWSYVHADDEAEGGRVVRLARDVVAQYEMLTGETIQLFLDRDAIEWGDNWRSRIEESLASVAFFIPVLSPRYFMSAECRNEMQTFARKAMSLGISELILPLLYVDVPFFLDEDNEDDLVVMVRKFQYGDWRVLRFEDVTSGAYRREVAQLAARLVDANKRAERVNITEAVLKAEPTSDDGVDESLGFVDRMARFEEGMPKLMETLNGLGQEIEQIAGLFNESTTQLQQSSAQGRGFSARLLEAIKLTNRLREPAERVWSFANDYVSQIHDVDEGIRTIIESAPEAIQADPDDRAGVCDFFQTIRTLSTTAHESLETTKGFIDALEPVEKISRDLRPVIRRLRNGLTIMYEARNVSDDWIKLIDASGIQCEKPDAQVDEL